MGLDQETFSAVASGERRCLASVMICPACSGELLARKAGAVEVDVCDGGCGGAWFDNFEMTRVDEEGKRIIRGVPRDLALVVDKVSKRRCPKCSDQVLLRRFFSRLRRTQIDECPNCAGVWLDAGEFEAIQKELEESPDTATLNPSLNHAVSMIRGRSGM